MAVNTIDAVFPQNSNYFLHTLKHRLFRTQNGSVTIVSKFGLSSTQRQPPQPMQQCMNCTERYHFGKRLQSSLSQQTNYAALLRQTINACD
eukprot:3913012-Pleurochrysis_carterae.AAC.1